MGKLKILEYEFMVAEDWIEKGLTSFSTEYLNWIHNERRVLTGLRQAQIIFGEVSYVSFSYLINQQVVLKQTKLLICVGFFVEVPTDNELVI